MCSRWQRFVWAILVVGISLGAQRLYAVSAENEYVIVSCPSPAVRIDVNGADFEIFAPRTSDSFDADVTIEEKFGWTLVEPSSSIKMKGGDRCRYKVKRPPEDAKEGLIFFHNYFIKTNQKGGSSDVIVPVGENVIYTARKDNSNCESDWIVNGESKSKTSSIVFNRNWWNVPSWFIPSLDSVKPNYYYVGAHDSKNAVLQDSGIMTVIGVEGLRVSGSGGSYGFVEETLYVEKGCQLLIQAVPTPNAGVWPEGNPKWTGATPQATSRDIAVLDTTRARELEVTASCGDSKVSLPIVIYECKFYLYVRNPAEDAPIKLIVNPLDSTIKEDVGHTSWKMEVKPSSATEYMKTQCSANFIQYLNVCVGYYPSTPVPWMADDESATPLGMLVLGDKSDGFAKTYDISNSQLIQGLSATEGVARNPGNYVLGTLLYLEEFRINTNSVVKIDKRYPSDRNCTSVCLDVMQQIGLPSISAFLKWRDGITIGGKMFLMGYWGNCPHALYQKIKETNQ